MTDLLVPNVGRVRGWEGLWQSSFPGSITRRVWDPPAEQYELKSCLWWEIWESSVQRVSTFSSNVMNGWDNDRSVCSADHLAMLKQIAVIISIWMMLLQILCYLLTWLGSIMPFLRCILLISVYVRFITSTSQLKVIALVLGYLALLCVVIFKLMVYIYSLFSYFRGIYFGNPSLEIKENCTFCFPVGRARLWKSYSTTSCLFH